MNNKMIKFINKLTGSEMWVAEDRKEEYLKAGHKLPGEPKPEKNASKRGKAKK